VIDTGDTYHEEIGLEQINLLFGVGAVVLNAAYVYQGQTSRVAAGTGFFFGATNLIAGSIGGSKYRGRDVIVGAAAIALSIWNLHGGFTQSPDEPYADEIYYDTGYSRSPPSTQTVGFSYSF
jgi:hypothetical protein